MLYFRFAFIASHVFLFHIQLINYVIVTDVLFEAVWFSVDPYMRQVTLEFILIDLVNNIAN